MREATPSKAATIKCYRPTFDSPKEAQPLMKTLKVSLLLMTVLLAPIAIGAQKTLSKKITKSTSETSHLAGQSVGKHWVPTAFNQDVDRLPPNYSGLDPVEFYRMLESKLANLKKDEFETSEEFSKRTSDKDALLFPLNTTDLYAFRMDTISVKYDADLQIYSTWDPHEFRCPKSSFYRSPEFWVTCDVSQVSRVEDEYIGSNAYGASRSINRTRGINLALAIKAASLMNNGAFLQDSDAEQDYFFRDFASVPLEYARDLKGMKISILFVGRITDAKIIDGKPRILSPTIDRTTDLFIESKAVPFELKKRIYYVVQTGEILSQKNFK